MAHGARPAVADRARLLVRRARIHSLLQYRDGGLACLGLNRRDYVSPFAIGEVVGSDHLGDPLEQLHVDRIPELLLDTRA